MKIKKQDLILFLSLVAGAVVLLFLLNMLYAPKLTQKTHDITISDQGIAMLPGVIVTDNTKITVSMALGQPPVTVYLYDTQYAKPIQEAALKGGKKVSFTMLTGSRSYQLGVQSAEPGDTHVKLKVAYLPT